MVMKKFSNSDVADIFDGYPLQIREKLQYLRQLIFETQQHVGQTVPGDPPIIRKGIRN